MKKDELFKYVINYFEDYYTSVETELKYNTAFQLLVAVILSAQCTDKRINSITPKLFESYPTPESISLASKEEIYSYIKSVTYPNNKASYLLGMSKLLVEEFNGIIPTEISDLQKLPGVGRKTANVVASILYNKQVMPVDTHVYRVSKRIGLVNFNAKTPLKVEKQLVKGFPNYVLNKAHHWLILYGRYVCKSKKPLCDECGLIDVCRHYKKRK